MKIIFNHKSTFLLLFILLGSITGVYANEDEFIYPELSFKYRKTSENERMLETKLSYYEGRDEIAMPGHALRFFTGWNEPVKMGEGITDENGKVSFVIPQDHYLPVNSEGMWFFAVEFEETDNAEGAREELEIMDVFLEMTLEEEDGKWVYLKAYYKIGNETIPVEYEDIQILVPRMFSKLQVAEGYFEEEGIAREEFQADIPGDDPDGMLTVIARFDEHPMFGTVEKSETIAWGLPRIHQSPEAVRALWTQYAPRWMVITLSILLLGVWGHYFYAVYSLFRIKKLSK